jgi:hypothetical protein
MTPLSGLGKALIIAGTIMAGIGVLFLIAPKIPWLGRLPGDLTVKRDGFRLYFPLTTCIIISILLTLLFNLFKK